MPWRREWHTIPVFLPGKSHGQRGLAGYTPWGRKESDMSEQLNNNNNKKQHIYLYRYIWGSIYIKTKIVASGPITSWQIDEKTVETVTDFFWSSTITADGYCSHEIKRRLLLGRKVVTNLESESKSCSIVSDSLRPRGLIMEFSRPEY